MKANIAKELAEMPKFFLLYFLLVRISIYLASLSYQWHLYTKQLVIERKKINAPGEVVCNMLSSFETMF